MYLTCEKKRPTKRCVFWKKYKKSPEGSCTFNDGRCSEIIEQCIGCKYIDKSTLGNYCLVYMNPSSSWKSIKCPMYVNPEEIKKQAEEEKKTNPLKASRRKAKGGV